MIWLTAAHLLAAGCDGSPHSVPTEWTVYRSAMVPEAVGIASDDVRDYLEAMGRVAALEATLEMPSCARGEGRVVFVGDGLGLASLGSSPTDQTFAYEEERCGSGWLIRLSGGGLLGRQYAAYEWLHSVGVRFFHPEEEFVPAVPDLPVGPRDVTQTPAYLYRSVSLHLTHPLELGDAFRLQNPAYMDEAERYIDWQIKNLASFGTGGAGLAELSDYGHRRGFPTSTGISLYQTQQGGSGGIIDPDDPRTNEEQIAEAIDARMGTDPASYPELFHISVAQTEFTDIDDQQAVAELTYFADYMAANYPDTKLTTGAHGTFGEPTDFYGTQFSLLAQFTPPNLGVKVHTLMFYDLFRPAPVYGNTDFNYFYDFMEQEYTTRELWYFPESAWWLTFDIPVPLYLPITIEARDRDLQGIRHMLDGKLEGHRVFGSGHEWGYWQNEYCSFRMAAFPDYRWRDCLRDITGTMGEAGDDVQAAVEQVVVWQDRDMFDAVILGWLVGTDQETELASSLGIVFHPLPPAPVEILNWTQGEVDDWNATILPWLQTIETDYRGLAATLAPLRADVPSDAHNVFDEIVDGIEMFGLRAGHQWRAYGAVVKLRDSQLNLSSALAAEADVQLADAQATTEEARAVVARREQGYRYAPLSRAIAGGPDGDQDSNWTTYSYRYLNRTHHVFYYTYVDDLVMEAFAGAQDAVAVADAILGPAQSLEVDVTDPSLTGYTIDYGDGVMEGEMASYSHDYAAPGTYDIVIDGTRGVDPYTYNASVAEVATEYNSGFTGTVTSPMGAQIIEGVLPGLAFGRTTSGKVALGFSSRNDGTVRPDLWVELDENLPSASFLETLPQDLMVPIVTHSTGDVVALISVQGAILDLAAEAGPAELRGQMSTDSVIAGVVAAGGGAFDLDGATALVASLLGYTVDTLPPSVGAVIQFTLP